jgi:hypothetical protein
MRADVSADALAHGGVRVGGDAPEGLDADAGDERFGIGAAFGVDVAAGAVVGPEEVGVDVRRTYAERRVTEPEPEPEPALELELVEPSPSPSLRLAVAPPFPAPYRALLTDPAQDQDQADVPLLLHPALAYPADRLRAQLVHLHHPHSNQASSLHHLHHPCQEHQQRPQGERRSRSHPYVHVQQVDDTHPKIPQEVVAPPAFSNALQPDRETPRFLMGRVFYI